MCCWALRLVLHDMSNPQDNRTCFGSRPPSPTGQAPRSSVTAPTVSLACDTRDYGNRAVRHGYILRKERPC